MYAPMKYITDINRSGKLAKPSVPSSNRIIPISENAELLDGDVIFISGDGTFIDDPVEVMSSGVLKEGQLDFPPIYALIGNDIPSSDSKVMRLKMIGLVIAISTTSAIGGSNARTVQLRLEAMYTGMGTAFKPSMMTMTINARASDPSVYREKGLVCYPACDLDGQDVVDPSAWAAPGHTDRPTDTILANVEWKLSAETSYHFNIARTPYGDVHADISPYFQFESIFYPNIYWKSSDGTMTKSMIADISSPVAIDQNSGALIFVCLVLLPVSTNPDGSMRHYLCSSLSPTSWRMTCHGAAMITHGFYHE